ncbi:MAG TPA: MFS transporter [Atribacteraceae bacterium]|nr:MFS transporter [Atribacteraceae bacterium]
MPRKILLVPFALGLIVIGFGISGTGPVVNAIARNFAVSPDIVGRVFFFQGLGYFLSILAGGFLGDMLRQAHILRLGLFIAMIGFSGVAFLPSFTPVVALFLVAGIGLGFLDCMINPAATAIFTKNPGTVLNLIHAFFGLGSMLAPWIYTALIRTDLNWQDYYKVVALFTFVTFIVFLPSFIPRNIHNNRFRDILTVFRKKAFWFMGATMIFYSAGVTTLNGWMVTHLVLRGWAETTAALFLSNFWLGLFIGRFSLSRLSDKIGHLNMIRLNSLGGILFTALAVFLPPGNLSMPVLLFIAGFMLSTAIPTTIAYAVVNYPGTTSTASGWVLFNNGLGIIIFPWLGGIIGSMSGFNVTLGLVPLYLFIMFIFQQLLAGEITRRTLGT